jgi:hypothetical protein
MRAYRFRKQGRSLAVAAIIAYLLVGAGAAPAQLFYEDFEDTTLATGATQNFGTIAGGIISYNDTDAANRARFVVRPTTGYSDPVLTYSFDVKAPVTVGSSGNNELIFRAGIGTANNTLQSTEFIYEAILYRTSNGGNVGAYTNNGNETMFLVANNQNAPLSFTSPIDSSNVTLNAYQYIPYIKNNTTGVFGQLKGISNMVDQDLTTSGFGTVIRFGIGSSTNGNTGTFALDNVRVVTGVDFVGTAPQMPGDVNGDGFVTIDDFNIIRDNFRKSPRSRSQGDLTSDGLVSLPDFKQWKGAFMGSGASLAGMDLSFLSVPEPSSIVLMLLVVSGMTGCRCRRRVS